MKPLLGLITNTKLPLDTAKEDLVLADYLSSSFNIKIVDVLDSAIDTYGIYNFLSIGNIWADVETLDELHAFEKQSSKNLQKIARTPFKTYNQLEYTEWNKLYLTDLFQKCYPVIPSVSSVDNLPQLGECEAFFVKPLQSWDGVGSYRATKGQLLKNPPQNSIIQPFFEFSAEVSFFMIDGECIYALRTKSPENRWELEEFTPDRQQKEFAERFSAYHPHKWYQRIDAIETASGELLLTEVEGNGAYKAFSCLSEITIQSFTAKLALSITNHGL